MGGTTAMPDNSTRLTRSIGTVTGWLGSFPAILGSVAIIGAWALVGPVFEFSDTWQLIINTGTTIVTFNMVFVIQNTQNRDGRAIQAKLDAQAGALDKILDALDLHDPDLRRLVGVEEAPEQTIKDEQELVREHAGVPRALTGARRARPVPPHQPRGAPTASSRAAVLRGEALSRPAAR